MLKNRLKGFIVLSVVSVFTFSNLSVIHVSAADTLGEIERYPIPSSNSQPRDLVSGPDGSLWFTQLNQDKISKSTTSGVISEYDLPSGYTKPTYMTNGPQDALWFTATGGTLGFAVGKITMSGDITMHDLPYAPDRMEQGKATKPDSAFDPMSITSGGGYIWLSRSNSRYIQKIDPTGAVSSVEITTIHTGPGGVHLRAYRAQHLVFDSYEGDGIWVKNRNMDSRVDDPRTMIEKIKFDGTRILHPVPADLEIRLARMTVGSDGRLWFGMNSGSGSAPGYVTSMTAQGDFDTIPLNTNRDYPYKMTVGPDNAIWGTINRAPNYGSGDKIFRIDPLTDQIDDYWEIPHVYSSGRKPMGITTGIDGNVWFVESVGNMVSKIGTGVSTIPDNDGDGLNFVQEVAQGTSDFIVDTDGDGINDYVESQWYTNRDDTFCNSTTQYCEYPDPLQKDLYVEVDWMVKPDPSGYSMKPTSSHIAAVEIAFANQNIRPHFDTGMLGGGNEVPYQSNVYFEPDTSDYDFYDYKNGNSGLGISPQFDSANRYGIWRYMLVAEKIKDGPGSHLGIAYNGDDDSMLAYGSILDEALDEEWNFDDRLPKTMIHELGHNLCLTNDDQMYWYVGQHSSCRFDGIDSWQASMDYVSAMNYNQPFLIDYSHGLNGVNDHDDWSAVMLGLDDFAHQEEGDTVAHSYSSGKKVKRDPGRILKDPKVKKPKHSNHNIYRTPSAH